MSSATKTFRFACEQCTDGTVLVETRPERYPVLAEDGTALSSEAGVIEDAFGAWPGFALETGTCDSCGATWAQATVTAVPRDRQAFDPSFYKPLRCPSCFHRFTREPLCYPGEDDVVEKRLEPYTAEEVTTVSDEYYSLYMTKGVECAWNDDCEVSRFYFKGVL